MHFYLLGAVATSINLLIGALIFTILYFYKDILENKIALAAILIYPFIPAYLFYDNIFTLMGAIADSVYYLASAQKSTQTLRIILILSMAFWTIHDTYYVSYFGIIANIFTTISALIALYRFRKNPKPVQEKITTS